MATDDARVRPTSSKTRRSSKVLPVTSHDVKCVVLGDGAVGKSALLLTYLSGRFPEDCPPGPIDGHSEFDHLSSHPTYLQQAKFTVALTLVDTYGQDEYDKLRERVCAFADVYMLCFDTSNPSSLERIKHHWIPEMRRYCSPDTPFIVAGLKTDIRTKAQASGEDVSKFITFSYGRKEADEMGAVHYAECSAKNNTCVKRVFEKAAQAAIQNNLSEDLKRNSCVLS